MDWDKLRVFHAAAEAGSFTHAGEGLGLSQSAVSRQIAGLEEEVGVALFHRHARGLILTEPGELLFRAAKETKLRLEGVRARLADTRERPSGELRVTTTAGLGLDWLVPRLGEFLAGYPEVQLKLLLTDEELDLAMREADVAIRLRQPLQGDLIQRRLFTVHYHAYASADYVKRHGAPREVAELDEHRILAFDGSGSTYLGGINALVTAGRGAKNPRAACLTINSVGGLRRAATLGYGIAVLPDYIVEPEAKLVRVLTETEMPTLEAYLVYPEEMRNVARVQVFRDFLISKAQRWSF